VQAQTISGVYRRQGVDGKSHIKIRVFAKNTLKIDPGFLKDRLDDFLISFDFEPDVVIFL
jgi:hypothetical protein